MFRLWLTSTLLLLLKISFSQALSIADLPEVLYKDVSVKFNFSITQIPCSDIYFKVINGKTKQDKCSIWIMPDSVGLCELVVLHKNGKQIANFYFTVEEKPILKGFIGPQGGGTIKKDRLLKVGGLLTRLEPELNLNIPIKTISYTIQVIRNGEPVAQITNNGARYESKTVDFINALKKDDLLIIYAITAQMNEKILTVQPMELKIEEIP